MNLSTNLGQLENSDLVRRLNETDAAYLIKHALIQETALESLLKQERKRLHRLVAEALEGLYADRMDEFAARLFQHYDAAGVRDKAIVYAERAGDAAVRISAYREAIAAYRRALELADAHADNTAPFIRLMTRLGRAYELDADYDAALHLYRATCEMARARAWRDLELAALVQHAKVLAVAAMRYDPKQSERVAHEALELARELDDKHAQARVLWTMLLLNLYGAGGARVGIRFGEQSLALARALDWREQIAFSLNDLAYAYQNLGDAARSQAYTREAIRLWRELDNKPMLTDSLSKQSMDALLLGEFQTARASIAESRALSQTIGNRWGESTSYLMEGYAQMMRGDFTAARALFHACMDAGDSILVHGPIVMARYELASLYAYFGQAERGAKFAYDALERTRNQELDWNAWAYTIVAQVEALRGDAEAAERAWAEIKEQPSEYFFERMLPAGAVRVVLAQAEREIRRGDLDAAQARSEQALARVQRSHYKIYAPAALEKLARVWMRRGAWEKAHALLDEAQTIAVALEMPQPCFEIALARWDLEIQRGDAAAHGARLNAQRELDNLLTHAPDDWRTTFLQTPIAHRVNGNA